MKLWPSLSLAILAAVAPHEKRVEAADGGVANTIPCEPPPPGDSRPWEYRAHVLSLFPRATPPLRFVGAFIGPWPDYEYELHIWQDSKGAFGELLHPVLDADSPISRLLDVQFDPKSGALTFGARFREGDEVYVGRLLGSRITGTVTCRGTTEKLVLRRVGTASAHGAPSSTSWVSKDQFECAMAMSRR
jgi:hypothetical protein